MFKEIIRTSCAGVFVLSLFLPFLASAATSCPYTWNTNLKVGIVSPDVMKLQQFLNNDPLTRVALDGPGSPGNETEKFGAMTKKAIIVFQGKYASDILIPNSLSRGNGIVGSATRAKLNALCVAPKTTSTTTGSVLGASTTLDMLTITVPNQPASSIMPANALYVPFTNIALTAGPKDVTVHTVTVRRVGPGSDQVFADVDLNDDTGSSISTAYFNSNHTATFKDEFTIPANTTMNLTVVGDAASDMSGHDGERPAVMVTAIDASSPIAGPLPVRGTFHAANSTLSIGSAHASLSGFDPNTARTRYIGDTNNIFSAIRISAGSTEALRLDGITWEQNGTASSADISNVVTIVNGTSYPTVLAENREYTSTFPGGIIIPKGESLEVLVRGDIGVTGSNRTAQFDIHSNTDVVLYGTTYGFGIGLSPESNTASSGNSVFLTDTGNSDGVALTPFFAGSTVSISSGASTYIGR